MKPTAWANKAMAFVLSPLVGTVVFLIFWLGMQGIYNGIAWGNLFDTDYLGFVVFLYLVGFAAEVVLGLPLLWLLMDRGWNSIMGFLIGGLVISLALILMTYGSYPPDWIVILMFATSSMIASLFFGYVGGWMQGHTDSSISGNA